MVPVTVLLMGCSEALTSEEALTCPTQSKTTGEAGEELLLNHCKCESKGFLCGIVDDSVAGLAGSMWDKLCPLDVSKWKACDLKALPPCRNTTFCPFSLGAAQKE